MLPISDGSQSSAYRRLDDYMRGVKEELATGAAVCVVRGDAVVHEWYDGRFDSNPGSRRSTRDSQFHLASIRKTHLGFAVSLAIEEGLIASVDDLAADYLEDADRTLLAGTTIRHLLTHSHGLRQGDAMGRVFPPGTGLERTITPGVNLLVRVVSRVFGRPLAEVLRERASGRSGFSAHGLARGSRRSASSGRTRLTAATAGTKPIVSASARELAYWGYLHVRKGRIGGRHIAPAAVFSPAAAIAAPEELPADCPRVGFFWWVQGRPLAVSELGPKLPQGAFQSLGVYGCAVLAIPSHDAVAVRMLNAYKPNPPGYDYLADIRGFGDVVIETLEYASTLRRTARR